MKTKYTLCMQHCAYDSEHYPFFQGCTPRLPIVFNTTKNMLYLIFLCMFTMDLFKTCWLKYIYEHNCWLLVIHQLLSLRTTHLLYKRTVLSLYSHQEVRKVPLDFHQYLTLISLHMSIHFKLRI